MGLLAKLKFKLRKRLPRTSVQEYVFTGSALASATDQLAVNMNSISFQQAPSGIDRGRNQSFFAMNAPQGNPFAAAGALHMPFPSQLHQQPFTGQQFGPPVMTPNSLERACKSNQDRYDAGRRICIQTGHGHYAPPPAPY
ncbi:hypothetical protein RAB80_011896 [Fusarium oxysporum f. sp. vasinfectum]|nr:hypothetical protein RAB80_011896 [Fusarium oxysporum f. sp. vasinfectum]KAK2928918.1 hypothetical protein FoTM2_011782 [Fusarium oxysporum f. sp. vasinfectum]